MLFCPTCANLLIVSDEDGSNTWVCQTCPYQFPITKQITSRTKLERKKMDDTRDATEEMIGQSKIAAFCEKCGNNEAYFSQIQIRSADEPMTTFYKCTACGAVRRED
ncbi:hypothetical protein GLOTRDRAFT_73326 [Gloeophyllum trabeum ATCC 11539]|uniref:DNA-directed RNA polymerase subunit n=1 Tax=Gloeophyllum trabeum (strain ATCC 11539 / FP-39264 / Madison 617) TaxID=670483 RepID=S7RUI7_GLOTA|nr:uncharacterized protein GLOTRDRAFT_73326 [Gloeophyllum trabeum ATCC 11539]EPQ56864.1 hypothetical protein GLOTRDRAFT_73326 [Gloeophyllum trabeum ATCC 11539]